MASANTLTGLIPTLYEAANVVAKEPVGLINAVGKDVSDQGAGYNQVIRVPIVPSAATSSITAGAYAADSGGETIDYADITLDNMKKTEIMWGKEEQKAFETNGRYKQVVQDQIAERMRALRNDVEASIAALYTKASRAYGTAGSTPFASSLADLAQLYKILSDNGAPDMGRYCVVNTTAGANLRSLANLSNVSAAGSAETLSKGNLIDIYGFGVRESAQIKYHTAGAMTGFQCSATEPIKETSIAFDGGTVNTTGCVAGDIVTIGSGGGTGTADTNKYVVKTGSTDTSGTIVIGKPGLILQHVDNDEITIGSSYYANMAFHKNAIQLVARPTAGGDSAVDETFVMDPATGLVFRVALYNQYMQSKIEVQLCWGVQMIKPEFAAILLG